MTEILDLNRERGQNFRLQQLQNLAVRQKN